MEKISVALLGLRTMGKGMAWLEHNGLDRDQALQVLKPGAPGSPLPSSISARMTSGENTVNFLLKLMSKDLAYAHAAGYADRDMSAVAKVLRHPAKP